MKCHAKETPPHSPNSAPWHNLLMAVTGNAKRKLAVNVVDSLRRKRVKNRTTNPLPLRRPKTTRTKDTKNNLLNEIPVHPLRAPTRKCWTSATNLEKMENSPLQ